jgi:hypothetical protein
LIDTFRAFDKEEDNQISRKEFMEFFEESWKAAFRILGEKVKESKQNEVSQSKINQWAIQ